MAMITSSSLFRRRPSRRNGSNKNGADLEEALISNDSAKKDKGFRPLLKLPLSTTVGCRLSAKAKDSISTFALAILAIICMDIAIKGVVLHGPVRPTEKDLNNLEITFGYSQRQHHGTHRVFTKKLHRIDPPTGPSYNGIEYWSVEDAAIFSRRLDPEDRSNFEEYREQALDANDEHIFHSQFQPDEDLEDQKQQCRRNNWRSKKFPNCNVMHELTLGRPPNVGQDFDIRYLGHGHFRDAWLFESDASEFAYKRLRLNDEFDVGYWDMHKIHREAIVMERLTHSPRIVDIYGHCSTTIISEPMPSDVSHDIVPGEGRAKQADLDKLDDVYPRNNFTATQKLEMSLAMAEALADIHGFEGGVILHGDTHPEQWLWSKDGRLVLNDFNNAEILDWDEENQRYCGSYRKYGGFYRAPEEYPGMEIYQGIDTFSLGNNIYTLLTGLWPFYDDESDFHRIQHKLINRERAYIDPRYSSRSYAENKLVEVMEHTWEFNPNDRISIFHVVKALRKAVRANKTFSKAGGQKRRLAHRAASNED